MGIGYKEQCIYRDGAIAYWSFDGDRFDRDNYFAEEIFIQDDIDNQSPLTIIDNAVQRAFRIGFPSGNRIEASNQFAARFGDPSLTSGTNFTKSMLTAPHSPIFDFRKNEGSFTIELLYKKSNEFGADDINGVNRLSMGAAVNGSHTKYAPLMRKNGVFTMGFQASGGSQTLEGSGPVGSFSIPASSEWAHLVLSFKVTRIDEFNWRGIQTVWQNNRIYSELTRNYVDFPPNTNVGQPFEIGGFTSLLGTSTNAAMGDRNCYFLDIDQIAVYDFGFDYDKVCEHFKKTTTYNNMISQDGPWIRWQCNDPEIPGVTTPSLTSWNGGCSPRAYLKGSYLRDQLGPTDIPTEKSILFRENGSAIFERWCTTYNCGEYRSTVYSNVDLSYSFEFWFTSEQTAPAVLLSLQGYDGNTTWTGPRLVLNMHGKIYSQGALTLYEADGKYVSTLGSYSNNEWNHIVIVRRGTVVELWTNGILAESKTIYAAGKTNFPGVLYLFGEGVATSAGPGKLSNFAGFSYALHPAQIRARQLFGIGYEIKGLVTIQGVPAQAIIRVYYSNTGEYVGEYESDAQTGEYHITLYTNANVDLLVYDKYNKNVRYRAFGPVAPSGYDDFPITI